MSGIEDSITEQQASAIPASTPVSTDPHKITLTTPGVEVIEGMAKGLRDRFPDTTLMHIEGRNFEAEALDAIEKQVKEYGTLKELVVHAHGFSSIMVSYDPFTHKPGDEGENLQTLHMASFMAGVEKLQERLGVKIADRIVFNGCSVFTGFTPDDVNTYRNMAQRLGTEIVGSIDLGEGSEYQKGAFYQFAPDGNVKRDPGLYMGDDSEYKEVLLYAHRIYGIPDLSHVWADCQAGNTPDAGEACQDSDRDLGDQFKLFDQKIKDRLKGTIENIPYPTSLQRDEIYELKKLDRMARGASISVKEDIELAHDIDQFMGTVFAPDIFSPDEAREFQGNLHINIAVLRGNLPSFVQMDQTSTPSGAMPFTPRVLPPGGGMTP